MLPNQYPRYLAPAPYPPNGFTPGMETTNCSSTSLICGYSLVYYLPIMGDAQYALSTTWDANRNQIPVSLGYPLVTAIGYAIGTISAHQTGHQLALPDMECGISGQPSCPEDYIYQNGGSGSNHEWFYEDISKEQIHWSQDAVLAIERYLLGTCKGDPKCP